MNKQAEVFAVLATKRAYDLLGDRLQITSYEGNIANENSEIVFCDKDLSRVLTVNNFLSKTIPIYIGVSFYSGIDEGYERMVVLANDCAKKFVSTLSKAPKKYFACRVVELLRSEEELLVKFVYFSQDEFLQEDYKKCVMSNRRKRR